MGDTETEEFGKRNLLSPKSDFVFKLIFGDVKNIEILRAFLIAALDIPRDEYEKIEFSDPHLKREFEDDKLGILDVLVTTKSGKMIDIEIQVMETPAMAERAMYYAASLLTGQMHSGMGYEKIRKVISILILDYNMISDSESYHNKYRLYDADTGSIFTDVLERHAMELRKLPEGGEGELYDWMKFIGAEREEEFEMIETKSPELKKAVGVLRRLSADERVRMEAEYRERARRDHYARMKGSYDKGKLEGLLEGKMEGKMDVAKNLLMQGFAPAVIAKVSGLSVEEIERLR
jgi:predicted transposase/invertase (TIGR01784 family)